MVDTLGWTLDEWRSAYRSGHSPRELLAALLAQLDPHDPAWIALLTPEQLELAVAVLEARCAGHADPCQQWPLYGIPCAVKDNIDVQGWATTAACPAFAYSPAEDAPVVAQLRAAGAIVIGKTNLDQFATGLVGTRSPYGVVPNVFAPDRISGGSSSGSAVAVARGWVPFALGTDTAGSGRVPAGFNNIVGLKPTRGALSSRGVVPACRSLDCVTFFTQTLAEADELLRLCQAYDAADPFSRAAPTSARLPPACARLGVPSQPDWHGDTAQALAWQAALAQWRDLPVELVELDFAVLFELAALLYQGPWVAERYAAVGGFIATQPDEVNPIVAGIITQATAFSATDAFRAQYRRQALMGEVAALLAQVDALLVPTAPLFPSIDQVTADPVTVNSWLGRYTNFVNLADLCALAVPAGFRDDGLPFGVTLIGPAWQEHALLHLAQLWQSHCVPEPGLSRRARPVPMPTWTLDNLPAGCLPVAVVGAHLTGMPLNSQLTERGAVLLMQTTTAPRYRLYSLPNTTPPKPGLLRVDAAGAALIVEVWAMPVAAFGSFVALIPAPLGIGSLELASGHWVKGFICESWALQGAQDITDWGGWRAYMASRQAR